MIILGKFFRYSLYLVICFIVSYDYHRFFLIENLFSLLLFFRCCPHEGTFELKTNSDISWTVDLTDTIFYFKFLAKLIAFIREILFYFLLLQDLLWTLLQLRFELLALKLFFYIFQDFTLGIWLSLECRQKKNNRLMGWKSYFNRSFNPRKARTAKYTAILQVNTHWNSQKKISFV